MHDAPPPPLDRRGIGRFRCQRVVSAADMLLNDPCSRRLRLLFSTHRVPVPKHLRNRRL